MITVRGEWFENGYMCNTLSDSVVLDLQDGQLIDAETGYVIQFDQNHGVWELTGWPCYDFLPNEHDIKNIKVYMLGL